MKTDWGNEKSAESLLWHQPRGSNPDPDCWCLEISLPQFVLAWPGEGRKQETLNLGKVRDVVLASGDQKRVYLQECEDTRAPIAQTLLSPIHATLLFPKPLPAPLLGIVPPKIVYLYSSWKNTLQYIAKNSMTKKFKYWIINLSFGLLVHFQNSLLTVVALGLAILVELSFNV